MPRGVHFAAMEEPKLLVDGGCRGVLGSANRTLEEPWGVKARAGLGRTVVRLGIERADKGLQERRRGPRRNCRQPGSLVTAFPDSGAFPGLAEQESYFR